MINLEGQSQVCALGIVYRNEAQRYTVLAVQLGVEPIEV